MKSKESRFYRDSFFMAKNVVKLRNEVIEQIALGIEMDTGQKPKALKPYECKARPNAQIPNKYLRFAIVILQP